MCGKLGGSKDILVEKLKLIAAELLNVLAPDAGGRLGKDLDHRTVGKAAFCFEDRAGQELLEAVI